MAIPDFSFTDGRLIPVGRFINGEDPIRYSIYQYWLEQNLYGGMAYLAAPRHMAPRQDPHLLWPDVQSILTFAFSYPNPTSLPMPQDGRVRGRIASYAWQTDYHLTLPVLLDRQMQLLSERLGLPFRWRSYTDSGPILERGLATCGGLGWIGRNTCLIQPGVGSYLLLAEVFTDQAPEVFNGLIPRVEEPISDHCGTCRRCIEVCPTGCIREDRLIDASHCISYLTIEHKGAIPRELRGKMGEWVFGCDLCQMVCPWNQRFASPGVPWALAIPDPYPDLMAELDLSPEQFKQRYADSPVLRAKRKGYLRNVCMALGNRGDRSATERLARVLSEDAESLVRASAAWALACVGGQSARLMLGKGLSTEMDEMVREEIMIALDVL